MSKIIKFSAIVMSLIIAVLALMPAGVVFAEEGEEPELIMEGEPVTVKVQEGATGKFSLPSGWENHVIFSSSNKDVLDVNESTGSYIAKKVGVASVTATNGELNKYKVYDCIVTVKPTTTTKPTTTKPTTTKPTTLKTLTVIATLKLSVEKGKTATLSHAGLSGNVTFRSGNPQIATVSTSGVVRAVNVGTTYIQAFNSTHVQNYEILVTEVEKETVTVEETTTEAAESETVTIEDIMNIEEDTTFPEFTTIAPVEQSTDNSSLKTKILIITAIIIAIIIVAAILIYRFIAARNNEDYPVDFYPEGDPDAASNSAVGPDGEELPEYNFSESAEDDVSSEAPADDPDSSFINENPESSDDDTFLL